MHSRICARRAGYTLGFAPLSIFTVYIALQVAYYFHFLPAWRHATAVFAVVARLSVRPSVFHS